MNKENNLTIPNQITIDGTAASGKSTVGKLVADRLGYLFFDTGIMYRIAAYEVLAQNCDIHDEKKVLDIINTLDIKIEANKDTGVIDIFSNGQNLNQYLHLPEVDKVVSITASYSGVRKALTAQQRRIGLQGHIVLVGRDTGTVVLPEAALKIYLLASPEKRAERRYNENLKNGIKLNYDEILEDIKKRDQADSTRKVAPLKPAPDAKIINTDELTVEEVCDSIMSFIKE